MDPRTSSPGADCGPRESSRGPRFVGAATTWGSCGTWGSRGIALAAAGTVLLAWGELVPLARSGPPGPERFGASPEWPARPAVPARDWRAIVVHHSDSPAGDAAQFHALHLKRGWDGLGYHFVVGNGRGLSDGELELGWRWVAQREGAHAGETYYNEHGIGICLVGNFETEPPSEAQWTALVRLVRQLVLDYGIAPEAIVGHGQIKVTACPGRHLSIESLRRAVRP